MPVLAAVSLLAASGFACLPASMVLMGGPIDPAANPTEVNRFAEAHSLNWFERTVITTVPGRYPGAFRRVYPGFLQLAGFSEHEPRTPCLGPLVDVREFGARRRRERRRHPRLLQGIQLGDGPAGGFLSAHHQAGVS